MDPRATPVGPGLDAVFAALADPTRRAILTRLLEAPQSVTALAAPFAMSLAAVSKHLRLLAQAGLVAQTRTGRVTLCRIEPEALDAAAVWIAGFGRYDAADYDALERLVAALGSDGGLDDPFGLDEID